MATIKKIKIDDITYNVYDNDALHDANAFDAAGSADAALVSSKEYTDTKTSALTSALEAHDIDMNAHPNIQELIMQSDWNQNNKDSLSYIKNRTHWVQYAETILASEKFECTTLASDSESYYCVKSGNIGLVAGNKYNVTVNGTVHEAVPALSAFGTNDVSLIADTETCRIYDRGNGTVEVFSDSSTTLTVSIEDAEDVYVKLDERFIPNVFARSTDVELKMDKENPTGTGSLSINRASGSTIGENSIAIGTDCVASGESAVAIGSGASATGFASHAEGTESVASGDLSHAEGQNSKATGYASHAESSGEANGDYSHAEGYGIADGDYSHASGNGTWAIGRSQTVIGEANLEDSAENSATRGTYAVIVGNGDMDAGEYSNAATLDWSGNACFAGSVYVGGASQEDEGVKILATQEYTDEQISSHTHSWNDLEDKPFYEDIVSTIVEYDGSKNAVSVFLGNKLGSVYLISELVPTSEQLVGAIVTYNSTTKVLTSDDIQDNANGTLYVNSFASGATGGFVVAYDLTQATNFPQMGIYANYGTPLTIELVATDIKQLDEKFIPSTIARMDNINKYLVVEEGTGTKSVLINTSTNISSGTCSFAEGGDTEASGDYSHAEGYKTVASGYKSHAEGDNTLADGTGSHAEGSITHSFGAYSHAEGYDTDADGECSHVEGKFSRAEGDYSHAEGYSAIASGNYSHVEGYETTASGDYQHVQGKYNVTGENYAHIVGNGTSDTRSNAHTLDWNGNAWFAGNVYVGGTSQENASMLCTEEMVSDRIVATEENTITGVINIFTPADAGKFLCVADDGSIKAVAFSNVSEVGA